jgi:hypothetical protein
VTNEELAKQRVWVMSISAVLPSQPDYEGPCVVLWPANRESACVWLERMPTIPQDYDGSARWLFRRPGFRMMPDVMVGTIDEIVEKFREQLMTAAETTVSNEAVPCKDVAKSLENAKQLGYTPGKAHLPGLKDLGEAITLPWLKRAVSDMEKLVG